MDNLVKESLKVIGIIFLAFIISCSVLFIAALKWSPKADPIKQAIICHINGNISYINREDNTIIYEKASNESCVTFPDKGFDQFLKAQFGKQGAPAL